MKAATVTPKVDHRGWAVEKLPGNEPRPKMDY
jgi:hypothetical protein